MYSLLHVHSCTVYCTCMQLLMVMSMLLTQLSSQGIRRHARQAHSSTLGRWRP